MSAFSLLFVQVCSVSCISDVFRRHRCIKLMLFIAFPCISCIWDVFGSHQLTNKTIKMMAFSLLFERFVHFGRFRRHHFVKMIDFSLRFLAFRLFGTFSDVIS